ncbi:MAG: dienelactone hydrolase family protein [Candidatus Acidiferrales bacterium]
MIKIATLSVTLQVADGTAMAAYVARPADTAPRPGLLIFQEAFGVNAHIREVTERFARAGLVALAPELFHRTAPGFEGHYDDFPAVTPHLRALTTEGMQHDIRAAYDWLRNDPQVRTDRIASIGFCMGGRASFLANATVPLQAAISFYGGGIAPALLPLVPSLYAPMIFFWGGRDQHIGHDQIRAVVDACKQHDKPYVNVEISDADHGFFCDARPSYNPAAADLAWNVCESVLHYHVHRPDVRTRVR